MTTTSSSQARPEMALTLSPLSIHHGPRPLVQEVSLSVPPARLVTLVGQSGSGKSLTASALAGTHLPGLRYSGGEVRSGAGVRLAHVLQNPRTAFNALMTMEAHALETLATLGVRGATAQPRVDEALTQVGLALEVKPLYPFELSGGMLQRMMIAIALLRKASFVIADEPTSDLDPRAQHRILTLLSELVHHHRLGVLLITHDLGVVAAFADEVHVMAEGRLVESTTPELLFERPQSAAASDLLSAHRALYGEEEFHAGA
ncbi:ATP-binding cassette domain-containing protein [Larsenimonas suaedae]|uniref:ATP-binding cassette domain-containing protein n=1 Tax=Larsenimonas suaedae TaxID=1851019 RepID=A0ABU1GRV7_9GAMM|nr:ATP-binding cassette domain-containing protein [Larsenimonas suaedae]MCM2972451.1 ATP-binding cassette domain-containing protein [Larsenimonas suaedae]MDR5894753.1 ATP-binding cassette domain-containing protein [Larsenimonas suaedae]